MRVGVLWWWWAGVYSCFFVVVVGWGVRMHLGKEREREGGGGGTFIAFLRVCSCGLALGKVAPPFRRFVLLVAALLCASSLMCILCVCWCTPAGAVTNVITQFGLLQEIGKYITAPEVRAVTSQTLHALGLDVHGPVVSVGVDDTVWAAVKVGRSSRVPRASC